MTVAFYAIIFVIVLGMIIALPVISIDANAVIASSAFSYIRAALYFIPTGTCAAILGIILGLWIFRVVISLIKTLWKILPGVADKLPGIIDAIRNFL